MTARSADGGHRAREPGGRGRVSSGSTRSACRAAAALALVGAPLGAQGASREAHAEFLIGGAWSVRTPLVVRLPGRAPIRLRARYTTRPWADAPYYAYRVGGGRAAGCGAPAGDEGELLHHKLYLENPAPPVEHFEVTHGYNLAGATALRPAGPVTVRFGLALVVAHAEGRVAGERVGGSRRTFLGGGYHLAGASAQLALGRRYALGRGDASVLYAVPEAKLTASLARVPVGDAGGSALVPNVAAHALAGLGVCRSWR
jgi:hypothetical protein